MPIIRSAIKKLRQDKKRTDQNLIVKKMVKKAIKTFKENPTQKLFSQLDKILSMAVKKHILHPNKSSRLKSRLTKKLDKKKVATAGEKPKVTKSKIVTKKPASKKKTVK